MGTLDKYVNQLIKSTFNYYRFRHITTVLEHISLSAVAVDVVRNTHFKGIIQRTKSDLNKRNR